MSDPQRPFGYEVVDSDIYHNKIKTEKKFKVINSF